MVIGLSTGGMYFISICNEDLNNDGYINIVDIVQLVIYILNLDTIEINESCLDINQDEFIDILDITSLIDYIFNHQ